MGWQYEREISTTKSSTVQSNNPFPPPPQKAASGFILLKFSPGKIQTIAQDSDPAIVQNIILALPKQDEQNLNSLSISEPSLLIQYEHASQV